jgi:hypothetical protein
MDGHYQLGMRDSIYILHVGPLNKRGRGERKRTEKKVFCFRGFNSRVYSTVRRGEKYRLSSTDLVPSDSKWTPKAPFSSKMGSAHLSGIGSQFSVCGPGQIYTCGDKGNVYISERVLEGERKCYHYAS